MALLVLDIGNSRVKAALFSDAGEAQPVMLRSPQALRAWTDVPIAYIDTRMASSWREALQKMGAVELGAELGLPFPTRYSARLGPDRAAGLVAAWHAKRFPAVVVSVGTAYTLDYLDAEGVHVGGVIGAGLLLRLRSLAHFTGRLPRVQPTADVPLLATDTAEALQAGALRGLAFELLGWLNALPAPPQVLWLCGGDAAWLRSYLPAYAIFAPDLILRGAWLWWHFIRGEWPSSAGFPSGPNSP